MGIRIPDNEIALAVLREAGVPLAVPSANISAHPSPTSAKMVYDDMKGLIPLILERLDVRTCFCRYRTLFLNMQILTFFIIL